MADAEGRGVVSSASVIKPPEICPDKGAERWDSAFRAPDQ